LSTKGFYKKTDVEITTVNPPQVFNSTLLIHLLKALNHFPIHPIWRTSNWWMLMTNSKKIKCPTSPVGEVSDLELKYVGEVRYIGYRVLSWFMVRFVLLFIVLFRLFEFFCFIVSCFDSCYSFFKIYEESGLAVQNNTPEIDFDDLCSDNTHRVLVREWLWKYEPPNHFPLTIWYIYIYIIYLFIYLWIYFLFIYLFIYIYKICLYTRKVGAKFTCELMNQNFIMQRESLSNAIGVDAIVGTAPARLTKRIPNDN
jgi:hypothetical protein